MAQSQVTNMQSVDELQRVSLVHKLMYSGISGAIATTIIYSLDSTKTRLMSDRGIGAQRQYFGPLDCIKKVFRAEGLGGLYRGWPPNVVLVMPEKALKLTVNDLVRRKLQARSPYPDRLPISFDVFAGGVAGLCQVVVTAPMERLKVLGALASQRYNAGEISKQMHYPELIRQLGIRGMYVGVVATWLRDIPFSCIYFSSYAYIKHALSNSSSQLPGISTNYSNLMAFIAGAGAGTLAAAMSNPLDVVKTRVQAALKHEPAAGGVIESDFWKHEVQSVIDTTKDLLKREGPSAFFKGVVPRCLIISPLFAITMTCYEKMQRVFH